MIGAGPLDSSDDARDLPCVRCGYNLRGLARSANCTECGTPIRDSALALGFRLDNRLAAHRIELGLCLFLLSILLAAAAHTAHIGLIRFHYAAPGAAWRLWEGGVRGYGELLAQAIELGSLFVMLCIVGRARYRHVFRLRIIVLVLGSLALVLAAVLTQRWLRVFLGTTTIKQGPIRFIVLNVMVFSFPLLRSIAVAFLWVVLASIVDRRRWPRAYVFCHLAIVAAVVSAIGEGMILFSRLADSYLVTFMVTDTPRPRWYMPSHSRIVRAAYQWGLWWRENIGGGCRIVLVLAAWVYLRGLESATRPNPPMTLSKEPRKTQSPP